MDSVDVEPGRIHGMLRAVEYLPDSHGAFHLTVPVVFIWVAQLAIIYACWEHDLHQKPGEIFVRDIQLKCKRSVVTPEQIQIVLSLDSKRTVEGGVYYAGSISVDQDAFIGAGRFVLPAITNKTPTSSQSHGVV